MRNPARSFFFHFLVSYLVVITINIAAYSIVYIRSNRTVVEQAKESIALQVQKGADLIAARLREIENSALQIGNDPDIVDFARVRKPLKIRDYYALLRIGGSFERYSVQNTFVDSAYLIFRSSGAVFSTIYTSPSFEQLYPSYVRYGKMSFREWEEIIDLWSSRIRLYPGHSIQMFSKKVHALTFRVPIAMGGLAPRATLLALITESSIVSHFDVLLQYESRLEISDRNGVTLLTHGPDIGPGQRGIRTTVEHPRTGLTFYAFVPNGFVAERSQLHRAMFLAIVIGTVTVALVVAFIFSFRTSRPLVRLFGMIVKAEGLDPSLAHPDSAFLVEAMGRFIGERVDIDRGIQRRKQLLHNGFYERLLRGGFGSENEVQEYLENLGMSLPPPPVVVAVVVPSDKALVTSHPVSEVLVHDYLESRREGSWHLHKTGEGDVLLLPGGEKSIEFLSKQLAELHANLGLSTVLAIGTPRHHVLELQGSFKEALAALRTTRWDPTGHVSTHYRETDGDSSLVSIRDLVDRGERVTAAIVNGNVDEVARELSVLRVIGLEHLSIKSVERFFEELTASAAKALASVHLGSLSLPPNPIRYIQRYASIEDFFDRLANILIPICTEFTNIKKSHAELQFERIALFVKDHHNDSQLTLARTAAEFGLNHQYLSRFFKENAGESFSSFVERLRMDSAVAAMTETTDSLRAVAEAAGYVSWNSFYKAFRRRHGMSPGGYREMKLSGDKLKI